MDFIDSLFDEKEEWISQEIVTEVENLGTLVVLNGVHIRTVGGLMSNDHRFVGEQRYIPALKRKATVWRRR